MNSEDRLIFEMDTFLVIEYIKAAIAIVMDLKFEEIETKLVENGITLQQRKSSDSQQLKRSHEMKELYPQKRPSSVKRVPPAHGSFGPSLEEMQKYQQEQQHFVVQSDRNKFDESKYRSSIDTTDAVPSCPDMYEKLIQDLEADVRKHIRVQ